VPGICFSGSRARQQFHFKDAGKFGMAWNIRGPAHLIERAPRPETSMPMLRRALIAALLVLPLAMTTAHAADKPHRLALQISDGDEAKMNAVLNVAANVSRHYSEKAEEVEIRIVAFNAGINMLLADRSPVLTRLKSFKQGMPNVTFEACGNTIDTLTRNEGKEPPLVENAERVTAGVVTLIELSEQGWTIVRP